ncbi:MAG: hypothetical protein ABSH12_05820 [Endomicrobiales bacterium]
MKEIIEKAISALKNVLTYRCSSALKAAGLQAVLGEVDQFETMLVLECSRVEERLSRVLDENGLLRDLVGVKQSDTVPQILRQGEELHALHNQVIALRISEEKLRQDAEALRARIAVVEYERNTIRHLRDEEARQFKRDLDDLKKQLQQFKDAVRKELTSKESAYEI